MKTHFPAIALSLLLLLNSCNDEPALFSTALPANGKELSCFPGRLQGAYLAADEASVVTITDKLITRHYDFDYKMHKDSISTSYKLSGDTLIDLTDSTKEKVVLMGDSLIQHADWTDTLFDVAEGDLLKKFKGYYFLNRQFVDSSWGVKTLSLHNGVLTVGRISLEEDVQKLKALTETQSDTLATTFTLSRRQLKKFVNQDGFSNKEIFTRMAVSTAATR